MFIPARTPDGVENQFTNVRIRFSRTFDRFLIITPQNAEVEISHAMLEQLHLRSILGVVPGPFHLVYEVDESPSHIQWGERPPVRDGIIAAWMNGKLLLNLGIMTGTGVFTNKKHETSVIINCDGYTNDSSQEHPDWERDGFVMERPTDMVVFDPSKAIIYGDFTVMDVCPDEVSCPLVFLDGPSLERGDGFWVYEGRAYKIREGKFVPTRKVGPTKADNLIISVKTPNGEKIIAVR